MILPALTGVSLLVMAAGSPGTDVDVATQHLSSHQRTVAVQAYITRATECVARTVTADPRYAGAGNIGDLIVDSMPSCAALIPSSIATIDQYFGNETGEAYYL